MGEGLHQEHWRGKTEPYGNNESGLCHFCGTDIVEHGDCNFLHSQHIPHTWCPIRLCQLKCQLREGHAGSARDAQLSAARMFQTKNNMAGYTGSRVQFEKLTSLEPGYSFQSIEIENGGIQYTPLMKAPQHWKTLVLCNVASGTRASAAWKKWYYWRCNPPECNEHLQGSAIFFRGFSFWRFCLWSRQPRHFSSPRLAGRRISKRHAFWWSRTLTRPMARG